MIGKVGKRCTIEGCDRHRVARGWCTRHYDAWRRQGDPLAPPRKPGSPASDLATRFWAKVDISERDGCWPWIGYVKPHTGYGQISLGRNGDPAAKAHRVAWELTNGPVPEGMCVLHRCDNRPCVRPDHLFLGTIGDNNRDRCTKGRCQGRCRHQ